MARNGIISGHDWRRRPSEQSLFVRELSSERARTRKRASERTVANSWMRSCLLYTSDAADDM
eukprot:668606-Rhodomonas_salina.4